MFDYIHPDGRQAVIENFSEIVEMPARYESNIIDHRFQHKDGSWVWLEARCSGKPGTVLEGYVISAREITDRKRFEKKLKRERDRLEKFASFISHDLRNPLSVIDGRVELARTDCESDSEHLDAIAGSVDRIYQLIEELVTIARTGGNEPVVDSLNLGKVAKKSWQTINSKTATLDVQSRQTLLADESQLQQILESFSRNAIEHGGQDVTISIGELDNGFYVEDDGRGIPEEYHESVLEYGFSTKSDGTGLGLSIVSEIVENHDWNIEIGQATDGGARFEITDVDIVATE